MITPTTLILGPIFITLVVFVVRRKPTAAVSVAILGLIVLAFVALSLDLDIAASGAVQAELEPGWELLGQLLKVTAPMRVALLVIYGITALLFLVSLLWPQGYTFVPLTLVLLAVMTLVVMLESSIYGAGLLLVASGVWAMLIQAERSGSTLASIRNLLMVALAAPLLMVAIWMIDSNQESFFSLATGLIPLAVIILLAGFPFHLWIAPTVIETRSLVPTVVFGVVQILVLTFVFQIIAADPAIARTQVFSTLVEASAVATLVVAGLLSLSGPSLERLAGYLLLLNIGTLLITVSAGNEIGMEIAYALLLARMISLLMAGVGLALLKHQLGNLPSGHHDGSGERGLFWRTPLGVALFVYGGLSLAGIPLTPGFVGTVSAIDIARDTGQWVSVVLVLASGAGAAAILYRTATRFVVPDYQTDQGPHNGQLQTMAETGKVKLAAWIILVAGFLLALFPGILLGLAVRMSG